MNRNLNRIVDWHRANTPRGTFKLAKGLSETTLNAFEKRVGVLMPRDIRDAYRLFNGTRGTWLLYFGEIMPLQGVERMWKQYCDWQSTDSYGLGDDWKTMLIQSTAIKPVWWNPLRFPLTDNGGGDPVFIDLDPGCGGRRGQLIRFNHETGPQYILADSLRDWLKQIADDLEAGKYEFDATESTVAAPGMYD